MTGKTVILVTRRNLGKVAGEDQAFGAEMLDKFFHVLEAHPTKPQAICFYTEGVKAVCKGSPHIMGLELLQGLGVRIAACQTCLDYYGLSDNVEVGEVVGMPQIVELLMEADRVLNV